MACAVRATRARAALLAAATAAAALALAQPAAAAFKGDFRAFVHNKYGREVVEQLERMDLGADASLGGSDVNEPRFSDEPVIIVHGITNRITRFNGIIHELHKRGYANGVFGTTWGDAGVTPVGLVELKCSYIKQIRLLIAVFEYVGKKVDVIAYSMGAAIARKAILGGLCVDTREVIGPPITMVVDTFVSVAGTNAGTAWCLLPLPVGTCNRRNGLQCDSEFLVDINAQTRYEGEHIFSVFSTHDDKVGFRACGRLASPIRKEDGYVKKVGLSHDQLMDTTHKTQINLIRKHLP